MNKALFTVLVIILVLAIAGGAFYGGMVYGKAQAQASTAARFAAFQGAANGGNGSAAILRGGQQGQGGLAARGQRGNGQGGFLFGTIKEIGDGTLVITDNNGKDTQVKVTDTTLIEKNASVKLSDLAQGETLMVSGSAAADGTITARSMQVAPQGRFGMGGPEGPAPQATPAPPATPAQ